MTLYAKWIPVPGDQNSSQQNGTTTRPATKATTAPQQTQTPAASPTTAAPVSTPADTGVSPTLTQAPAPLCGALAGLLAAGLLLRRKE